MFRSINSRKRSTSPRSTNIAYQRDDEGSAMIKLIIEAEFEQLDHICAGSGRLRRTDEVDSAQVRRADVNGGDVWRRGATQKSGEREAGNRHPDLEASQVREGSRSHAAV